MSQTKLGSITEAWTNVLVGFGLNWIFNILLFRAKGYQVTGWDAFEIGVWFTFISFIRSLTLRRLFNGWSWGHKNAAD